jgi:starch synthase
VAYVGRLDEQKGVQLIHHAACYALAQGAQFVLVGSSTSREISEEFWRLRWQLNDHPDCHLELGYDPKLAHLVYAGSDLVVMPSMYERAG